MIDQGTTKGFTLDYVKVLLDDPAMLLNGGCMEVSWFDGEYDVVEEE